MRQVKTVKVDFSRGLRGGLVRASQSRASEPLRVGDRVETIDPAEDMEFTGTVERLDDEGRFAYLRMDWEDAQPPHSFTVVYRDANRDIDVSPPLDPGQARLSYLDSLSAFPGLDGLAVAEAMPAVQQIVGAGGIPSAEAFGTPTVSNRFAGSFIAGEVEAGVLTLAGEAWEDDETYSNPLMAMIAQ